MSLTQDLQKIRERILPTDPSFRRIDPAVIDSCLREARESALEGSKAAFLLSAMRLLALPGNGHTRLIPNDSLSVLPLRLVSIGSTVQLTATAPSTPAPRGELIAVNGTPLARIKAAADKYLAGTGQRKRVIGTILLVWPHALARLGFSSDPNRTVYRVKDENGQITDLALESGQTVPASMLYPRNEHGRADPAWKPEGFVAVEDWQGLGLSLALPSFFDPSGKALPDAIAGATAQVRASPNRNLLLDLRGNTGGNFVTTLPLIDALCESARGRVAVLVDKFTFSAAIVFVAILRHRLGRGLILIGEEMGDGLVFHAEGGLLDLPASGAVVRYSTAFHDWETGTPDETTPAEIARHLVPAGRLSLDRHWVAGSAVEGPQGATHRQLLHSLAAQA